MTTNYPLGTIAYCKVCGNYVQLELSPEIGEYWALLDARELTEADKAYAVDIHCGCMVLQKKETCSLCGQPTEFEAGGARAQWYLCPDCEGTDAAREKGFFHCRS